MAADRRIELVTCDVDGTLLKRGAAEITPRTAEAIRRVQQQGVRFSLISGRVLPSVLRFARQADVLGPVAGLNGGIIGTSESDLSHIVPLDAGEVADLVSEGKQWDAVASVFCQSRILVPAQRSDVRYHLRSFGHPEDFLEVEDVARFLDDLVPIRVHFLAEPQTIERMIEQKGSLWQSRFALFTYSSVRGDVWHLEVGRPGYDKGTALQFLASRLGVNVENVMAIGDWINDVQMFSAAGVAVAMKNAIEPVRLSAHLITELTNSEDGLAQFLEGYFLAEA